MQAKLPEDYLLHQSLEEPKKLFKVAEKLLQFQNTSDEDIALMIQEFQEKRAKALGQLKHQKACYQSSYCSANAAGKRLLRFQFKRLSRIIYELQTADKTTI